MAVREPPMREHLVEEAVRKHEGIQQALDVYLPICQQALAYVPSLPRTTITVPRIRITSQMITSNSDCTM